MESKYPDPTPEQIAAEAERLRSKRSPQPRPRASSPPHETIQAARDAAYEQAIERFDALSDAEQVRRDVFMLEQRGERVTDLMGRRDQ